MHDCLTNQWVNAPNVLLVYVHIAMLSTRNLINYCMRILITGHRGYIGTQLVRRLSKLHEIFGIDLLEGNDLLTCDFEHDVDLVIHLAGRSGVRQSLKDPTAYWLNNIEASRRLFDRYQGTRILYASSSSQYEPHLNPYAASKHCLESLANCYPNTLGMRFHTVYSDNPREGMFFDKLKKGTLEYVTNHSRDFVHMDDVLSAIELLIEHTEVMGTIDIGTGNSVQIKELAPGLPIRLHTPYERQHTRANTAQLLRLGWKCIHQTPKNMLTSTAKENILEYKL